MCFERTDNIHNLIQLASVRQDIQIFISPSIHSNQLRSLHRLFLQEPMCQAVKVAPVYGVTRLLKEGAHILPQRPEEGQSYK